MMSGRSGGGRSGGGRQLRSTRELVKGNVVTLDGDTYQHRAELKARGWKWNAGARVWWLPSESFTDEMMAWVHSLPGSITAGSDSFI